MADPAGMVSRTFGNCPDRTQVHEDVPLVLLQHRQVPGLTDPYLVACDLDLGARDTLNSALGAEPSGLRGAVSWRILPVMVDFARRIRLPILLLAVLVVACAADLAPASMLMADGQSCVGSDCEDQIACGQPTQPQIPSGFSIQLVALPASGEQVLTVVKTEARTVDPPPATVLRQSLAPLGSRSPPAV
jgi:hypothetical protein